MQQSVSWRGRTHKMLNVLKAFCTE